MNLVVGLTSLRGIVPELELAELRNVSRKAGITFWYKEFSPRPQMSLGEALGPIVFTLSGLDFRYLLSAVASHGIYDAVKLLLLTVWRRVLGKKLTTLSASGETRQHDAFLTVVFEGKDGATRVELRNAPEPLMEKCVEEAFRLAERSITSKGRRLRARDVSYVVSYSSDKSKIEVSGPRKKATSRKHG